MGASGSGGTLIGSEGAGAGLPLAALLSHSLAHKVFPAHLLSSGAEWKRLLSVLPRYSKGLLGRRRTRANASYWTGKQSSPAFFAPFIHFQSKGFRGVIGCDMKQPGFGRPPRAYWVTSACQLYNLILSLGYDSGHSLLLSPNWIE